MKNNRLVRTHYGVRTGAFLFCLVTIGLHLWERDAGRAAWLFLALQFAVYPHLVHLRALHSTRPTRAELDNLLLDAILLGAWCSQLGFPTWIAYALVSSTALNAAVNRGAYGVLCSLGCNVAGAALGIAIGGFHYAPQTSPLVTALCFFGSLAYACAVGFVVHQQNRRLGKGHDALRESEARYRLIAENAADLIALVDQNGRWHYSSPSYAKILDADSLQPGSDAFARLHPDDSERARVAVLRAAATGRPRELPIRLIDREGRLRKFKMRMQAVDSANSEKPGSEPGAVPTGKAPAARVVLVSQDVTDLRESEERVLVAAQALEGMTEAIMITAADGTVLTVNKAFTQITGYVREDVLGALEKTVRNALQPPEYYDEIYAAVRRDGYWSGTTWSRRRNGSVYREWRSVRSVRDPEGGVTHYVVVFSEVGAPRSQNGQSASEA